MRGWIAKFRGHLPHAHDGALVGVDQPILTPEHKRRLHRDHGALAVDMESHGAARFAVLHGLPFVALRAIADPQRRALPNAAMAGFKADGSADVLAVLAALARSPGAARRPDPHGVRRAGRNGRLTRQPPPAWRAFSASTISFSFSSTWAE